MIPDLGKKPGSEFEPFEDYVLIDMIPVGMTAGGVALPDESDCAPPIGKVVKAGPGRTLESGGRQEMPCREGDIILFKTERYRPANEVEIDGAKLYLMRAVDVMGCMKRAA